MNGKDKKNIKHIIYYCEATASDIEYFGDDFNEYLTNDHYQRACAFNIIQIGEYIGRLSDEFKDQHPDIAWNSLKAMRNIHAHDYENVIEHLVWETMKVELPELKEYLEKLL
ncbi:HepT-like ribonuclease domain-containing protein [Methanobrevibacter sp.]|uniref:HepT-like ribonuclease domain-containing protein n=1 Tax=Methanobrevibacter sp. TaxID=66852 RepID=UPI002E79B911|nr:HepT-like ribonuclease domain-containing protein [Methanobrevibacter sp.]MEE0025842.1 HepT-like ribonuclease domain-containing protein [Methanobrevibacter sp.]